MEKRVTITGLAFGGSGISRIHETDADKGKVVFVPLTAAGDEVVIEITSEKKTFCEAVLKEIIKAGPERVEPSCRWHGACGGCSWGHIRYEAQVAWKARILEETLGRLGRIDTKKVRFDSPSHAPKEFNYRSRARFHCADGKMGLYGPKTHEICPIDACPLLDVRINAAYAEVREVLTAAGAKSVESVEMGCGADGPATAVIHIHGGLSPALYKALIKADSRSLKGFEVRHSSSGRVVASHGDVMLTSRSGGFDISSGPGAFSQANQAHNKALVDKVVDYAGLAGSERVLDLYCGSGNLSLPLAVHAGFVTGVEAQAEAVGRAAANAAENGITNVAFYRAGVAGWLGRNLKDLEKDRADVVVLDPPRDGEHEAVKVPAVLRP